MNIFVYVSDATERTIITNEDHGTSWEMKDGEVYDLLARTDTDKSVIVMDGRPASAEVVLKEEFEKLM